MSIKICITKAQAEIAISILHREIGYCGDDDDQLADLVETLERATKEPEIGRCPMSYAQHHAEE